LFREGLLRLLRSDERFEVTGACGTAAEARVELRRAPVDVLILDYDLGPEPSLDLVREMQRDGFTGKIMMVTAGIPDRMALEFIQLGVAGIFHKQHSPEDLQRAIVEVAQGRVVIEQGYLKNLVTTAATMGTGNGHRLTERDLAILRCLVEGLANKEIAGQLEISESAVKASLQTLFAKTGVRTRAQLVRIALEQYREVI
jgi:two-component system nitrate/nitrite response regulator NarL